jgi:hypothetical protein
MPCTIGEEMQYMCEGKEGIELKTYPIGVGIVEVAGYPAMFLTQIYLERIARVFLRRLLVLYS